VQAGSSVTVDHPEVGDVSVTFTVPAEYKGGDRIRIRHLASMVDDNNSNNVEN
jgi:hypothetical protein